MIRKSIFISCALLMVALQSCQTGTDSSAQKDTVFTKSDFIAVDGRDTAIMNLRTGNDIVEGKLVLKLYNQEDNDGFVRGSFKKDTLFVDYSFRKGAKKIIYKNPLAFLKRNGELVLGVGKMESMFGRTYLRKDVPIEFYQGRFTFKPVPIQ